MGNQAAVDNATSGLMGGDILAGLVSPSAKAKALKVSDEPITIPLSKIHPWAEQPRQYFSADSIEQLKNSFIKYGFKGSLTVRPHPTIEGEYQLVAGERRYRAATLAKIENVVCFEGDFTDEEALDFALGENLHREDLSQLEATNGILNLIQTRYSIQPEITVEIVNTQGHDSDGSNVTPSDDLASIVAVLTEYGIKLQTFRTSYLPTLKLQEILKQAHLEQGLSFLAAKALNQIKHDRPLKALLDEALKDKLSVRRVRERVKEELAKKDTWYKDDKSAGSDSKNEGTAKTTTASAKAKKPEPVERIAELKTVAADIHKARKTIAADKAKMRKVDRLLKQLKELLIEQE